MNLSEFKAWFEGFTESMNGPPGLKAWQRIQARVKEIREAPTPLHRIVHEYPWYRPYWASSAGNLQQLSQQLQSSQMAACLGQNAQQSAAPQNYQNTFRDVGRQEAAIDS